MHRVTINEAQTHLATLIRECLAGEEVLIAGDEEPLVKLTPVAKPTHDRGIGGAKGLITFMADDFDEPLDDSCIVIPSTDCSSPKPITRA